MLYMDLDKFKFINDTKGHAFGDQLLKETASRLIQLIRHSDTFARIGGDEFVFLLENTSRKSDAAAMAEMILKELDRVFVINDEEVKVNCSLAIYPEDGSTMDALLTAADVAMYKAKQGGRGTYKFLSVLKIVSTVVTHFLDNDRRVVEVIDSAF